MSLGEPAGGRAADGVVAQRSGQEKRSLRASPGPRTRVAIGILVVAALISVPLLGASVYTVVICTSLLAYGLLGMSISFAGGHAGLLSLTHGAYAGVAAYATVLVARQWTSDVLVQLLAAVVAGVVVAALTGWIVVRASGAFFIMLSLAIGALLQVIAIQWRPVTRGSDGISAGSAFTLFGSEPIVLTGLVYWVCVAVFVVFGGILLLAIRSPFGAALRGIKDNEARMRSLGYRTSWYKFGGWLLSGGVAGAAGFLVVAQLPRLITPELLSFRMAGLFLLAVVMGGLGSMWGAFLGSSIVVLMTTTISQDLDGHGPLVLGLIFVIAVYAFPKGIAGLVRKRRARRDAPAPTQASVTRPADSLLIEDEVR